MKKISVLLTNIILSGRTGTEIQVRNIALALLRRGHRPIVYAPEHGAIVDALRRASIPVVADLGEIRQAVDIIHGHHLPTTIAASAFFPDVPVVFFCHDFVAWHDEPPLLPSVRRFLAVDETVYDRLTVESGIPPGQAEVMLNTVDTERFQVGPDLPERPRRALAFAKNHGHVAAIRTACEKRGMTVDFVGPAVGKLIHAPERLMPEYDLVFASALTAMEAMACGRAVISCDGRGLAGWCDRAAYTNWRRLNFGLRTLLKPVTEQTIGEALDAYDAHEAAEVCRLIRGEGGMEAYAGQLEHLYSAVIEEHGAAPHAPEALLRALGRELQAWYPNAARGWGWLRERESLLRSIDELSMGIRDFPIGETRRFGTTEPERWWSAGAGLSAPEPWGVWTTGGLASALIQVPQVEDLHATLQLHAFLPDPGRRVLELDLLLNGVPMCQFKFQDADAHLLEFHIPAHVIAHDGSLWMSFVIRHHCSPQSLIPGNPDSRSLGVGLLALSLRRSATTTSPSA